MKKVSLKSLLFFSILGFSFASAAAVKPDTVARTQCEKRAVSLAAASYKPVHPSCYISDYLITGTSNMTLPAGYIGVTAYPGNHMLCGGGEVVLMKITKGSQATDCELELY